LDHTGDKAGGLLQRMRIEPVCAGALVSCPLLIHLKDE
jgi:hypothetical protein